MSPPVLMQSLEENDDKFENYLFVLLINKSSVRAALRKVYDAMVYDRSDPSRTIFWLGDDDRIILARRLFGCHLDDIDDLQTYTRERIAGRIDEIRTVPLREKGYLYHLVMVVVEGIINVHDDLAMYFVMSDRKQEVESMMITYIIEILWEFRARFTDILYRHRDGLERQMSMSSSQIIDPNPSEENLKFEMRDIIVKSQELMEWCIREYQNNSEIEGMIDAVVKQMQLIYQRKR